MQNNQFVNLDTVKLAYLMGDLLETYSLSHQNRDDNVIRSAKSSIEQKIFLAHLFEIVISGNNMNYAVDCSIDNWRIRIRPAGYLISKLDYINTKIQNDKYKKYELISGWILYIIYVIFYMLGMSLALSIAEQWLDTTKTSTQKKIIKCLSYSVLFFLNLLVNIIALICIINSIVSPVLVIAVIFAIMNLSAGICYANDDKEMFFPKTVFVAEYQNIKNFIQEYSERVININLDDSISNAETEISENEKSENEEQIPNLDNGLNLSNEVVIFEIPSK